MSPARIDVDAELALLLKPAKASVVEAPAADARGAKAASGKGAASAGKGGGKGKGGAKDQDLPEYEFSAEEADADTYDGETVVLDDSYHIITLDRQRNLVVEKSAAFARALIERIGYREPVQPVQVNAAE